MERQERGRSSHRQDVARTWNSFVHVIFSFPAWHEKAAARLEVHVVPIYSHFQAVVVAVGLDVVEGELEDVDNVRRFGEAFESALKVVAVAKESAAGSVSERGHCAFGGQHGGAAEVGLLLDGGEGRPRGVLAGREFGGVETARIESADCDIGLGGEVHKLRFGEDRLLLEGDEAGRDKDDHALTRQSGHGADKCGEIRVRDVDILPAKIEDAGGGCVHLVLNRVLLVLRIEARVAVDDLAECVLECGALVVMFLVNLYGLKVRDARTLSTIGAIHVVRLQAQDGLLQVGMIARKAAVGFAGE